MYKCNLTLVAVAFLRSVTDSFSFTPAVFHIDFTALLTRDVVKGSGCPDDPGYVTNTALSSLANSESNREVFFCCEDT